MECIEKRRNIPNKGASASEEYPTSSGPADYVLVVEGNIIGIIEAKKMMPESKISDPQPNDAHVFVATIQSMYRLLTGEEEPEKETEDDDCFRFDYF